MRLTSRSFGAIVLIGAMILAFVVLLAMHRGDEEATPPPQIVVVEDHENHRLVVNDTQTDLVWDEFRIQMSEPGAFRHQQEEELRIVEPLVFVDVPHRLPIAEGDWLELCREAGPGVMEVTIRHIGSRHVVGSWSFHELQGCDELTEEPT